MTAPLHDTHCHLAAEDSDAHRAEVVARARAARMSAAHVASEDLSASNRARPFPRLGPAAP